MHAQLVRAKIGVLALFHHYVGAVNSHLRHHLTLIVSTDTVHDGRITTVALV